MFGKDQRNSDYRRRPSLNILIKLISMVSVATIGITMAINNGQGLVKMVMEALLR